MYVCKHWEAVSSWCVCGMTHCRNSDGRVKTVSSSSAMKTASALVVACKLHSFVFDSLSTWSNLLDGDDTQWSVWTTVWCCAFLRILTTTVHCDDALAVWAVRLTLWICFICASNCFTICKFILLLKSFWLFSANIMSQKWPILCRVGR